MQGKYLWEAYTLQGGEEIKKRKKKRKIDMYIKSFFTIFRFYLYFLRFFSVVLYDSVS